MNRPRCAAPPARAQSGFEPEPVLKATDLVAPGLLTGPHFTVDPRVPVKGFLELDRSCEGIDRTV